MSRYRSRSAHARHMGDLLESAAYDLGGEHRSYEAPSFEQEVRHLMKVTGMPKGQAESAVAQTRAGIGRVNLPASSSTPGNIRTAAQFTINVRRDTANIAQNLPFAVFGSLDVASGYRQVITGDLPTGVALTSVAIGESGAKPFSVVFTYTAAGPLVDTVTVTCNTAPYPNIMQSLITDLLLVNKLRVSLSDQAQVAQYGFATVAKTRNLFGANFENPVTPADFKSPEQYQQGIVDLDVDWKFDKETMMTSYILPVAGFNVNYSLFIERFFRQSARDWAT